MGQKDILQKWKGLESFDICFTITFNSDDQSFIFGYERGH